MASDPEDKAHRFLQGFSTPDWVARYAEGPPRFVPGLDALYRMTAVLLAEKAEAGASILVLGAGGGLELNAFARAQPGWTFVGVDPAEAMLDLAAQTLGPLMERVQLLKGYIDDAPPGPFDAATCLLTLHFLDAPGRRHTLEAIRRRLKPGAPFVAAHSSFPQDAASRSVWLDRYVAYALAAGVDAEHVAIARKTVEGSLHLLDPAEEEAIMRDAGFSDPVLFFTAFTWRGWVAYA